MSFAVNGKPRRRRRHCHEPAQMCINYKLREPRFDFDDMLSPLTAHKYTSTLRRQSSFSLKLRILGCARDIYFNSKSLLACFLECLYPTFVLANKMRSLPYFFLHFWTYHDTLH